MADDTVQEGAVEEQAAPEEAAPAAPAAEAPTAPAPAKEESAEVEVPAKFKSIVADIEKMSVMELSELVKVFEKKFGVSAAAVAVAGPAAAGGADAGEEKSNFTIELTDAGANKIFRHQGS